MMINTQGNAGEKRKKLEGLDETGTVKAGLMPPEFKLGLAEAKLRRRRFGLTGNQPCAPCAAS
jgi:hypothetical protein